MAEAGTKTLRTFIANAVGIVVVTALTLLAFGVYIAQLQVFFVVEERFNQAFQRQIAAIDEPHIADGVVATMRFAFLNELSLSKDSPIKVCVINRKIDWDCVGIQPNSSTRSIALRFKWR